MGQDNLAKIIVADNDREFRELAVFALRFAGYKTFGASDGEECCRLSKQTKPDLILIHINLPDMNGYETCKSLKSDLDTASIPVILMATETDKPKAQAGLGESDVTIISKPIGLDQLTEIVHSFIKKGRL
jgi:CheY-like chemotaxis protein